MTMIDADTAITTMIGILAYMILMKMIKMKEWDGLKFWNLFYSTFATRGYDSLAIRLSLFFSGTAKVISTDAGYDHR